MRSFASLLAVGLVASLVSFNATLRAQAPAAPTPAVKQLVIPVPSVPGAPAAQAPAAPTKVSAYPLNVTPVVAVDAAARTIDIGKKTIRKVRVLETTKITMEDGQPATFESLAAGQSVTGYIIKLSDGTLNAKSLKIRNQTAPAAPSTPATPAPATISIPVPAVPAATATPKP